MRAADDFPAIRSRMEKLRRQRLWLCKDDPDLIRGTKTWVRPPRWWPARVSRRSEVGGQGTGL